MAEMRTIKKWDKSTLYFIGEKEYQLTPPNKTTGTKIIAANDNEAIKKVETKIKNQAGNHPRKDTKIKVEPITDIKKIKKIKKDLADDPRNLCLFTFGINTNLRASDLQKIKVGDVRHLAEGDTLELKEQKTKKARRITLNKAVIDAIHGLLESTEHRDTDYLFKSQRGSKAVSTSSMNRLVKTWCNDVGLKGNYGSHTLRKTWGYHQRQAGTDIPTLMAMFNHSSQKQTLDYLCIQAEEIHEAYLKVNL
jgi:integrase